MMNVIFAGIILFSFVFAALTGRMPQLSEAAMGQAGEAVTLVLSLTGMLCLWSGLMKIAQESGLTECSPACSLRSQNAFSRVCAPTARR